MTAFYNEHDPYAAQWLRNLIAAGHIAPGIVDERDIQDIEAYELSEFTQVHMFAGIGIWSAALRKNGWSDDRPTWTGSCPCQPFSNAGQRKGTSDERHLWPIWKNLIAQCRPSVVVGEQVASKDGREWLGAVSLEMEALGFAFGASDLCAAGFGQAHIRQREYFVGLADDDDARLQGWAGMPERRDQRATRASGMAGGMGDTAIAASERDAGEVSSAQERFDGARLAVNRGFGVGPTNASSLGGMEHSDEPGSDEWARSGEQSLRLVGDSTVQGSNLRDPGEIDQRWLDADWLLCRNPTGEPSWRPVEPRTFPLAHGIANRMGKLRAYGNGLDFETATGFVAVVKEIVDGV